MKELGRGNAASAALAIIFVIAATACGVEVTGQPQPQSSALRLEPRQTDDQGRTLPFRTNFKHRWNSSNNGSTYEPCTSVTNVVQSKLGFIPNSARDSATVDGQTARGCRWRYPDSAWTISQAVGNSPSLSSYKALNSTAIDWLADIVIDGRPVGVATDPSAGCTTYVQSGGAGVVTVASYIRLPTIPTSQICGRAISLTAATISQIPR
ncbi:DUF3558 domain-containing protein [Gordonia soli]|uniref:DUF3558 domain-containing protein n=1 Tax=Gordonia soli TaxID=320799 RepID=UPI0012F7F309